MEVYVYPEEISTPSLVCIEAVIVHILDAFDGFPLV